VVHLLASLSESYESLVTALEASEKVPSIEIVIGCLLYENKKSKGQLGDFTMNLKVALMVKRKSVPWKFGITLLWENVGFAEGLLGARNEGEIHKTSRTEEIISSVEVGRINM